MKQRISLLGLGLLTMSLVFSGCSGENNDKAADKGDAQVEIPMIPLEDFFKNSERTRYQISPGGEYYAYMAPVDNEAGEGRMNVFVKKIGEESATQVTDVKDRDIAFYFWASNERILYGRDFGGNENFALFGVNLDGSNPKELTNFENVRTQIIDDLEDNPSEIIIGLNKRNPQVYDPYRLNIESGEMTMLYENPGNISGWFTDHDGLLRGATVTDGISAAVMVRDTEEDDFRVIVQTDFRESVSPVFFTFDNKNIYAVSNRGRDKAAAVIISSENGEELEELFVHDVVDVNGINYSRKRKVLTSISWTLDKRERKILDEQTEKLYKNLEAQLPGYEVFPTSSDKNEENFIVRTFSDRSLGTYYSYNLPEDKLTKIDDVSPWLDENVMAEMKPIQYTSRDGLTIRGYLTLPKGREAKNLPVVINPHGGPWARDSWGFNSEAQFLANRGYAILQMNFRGSTGFGREFWEASFNEWGLKMQDDISDGAQWLIDEGIADPKRIAIYGGSYGGYATLAGLTYTPDLYACGVDYVGVSNLFTFMNTFPPYWEPYRAMMYEMVGNPGVEEDSLRLAATSPALNAEKIKAPLFIAQGAKDPRVNVAESDQMVDAMKQRGIDVEYMVEPEEGHGFRNEENRFKFYRAMEKFLSKHIGDSEAAGEGDGKEEMTMEKTSEEPIAETGE